MDKKKSLLNVLISIFFKIILVVTSILTKRFLIKYVGNDANGVNSLYISIIGVLSIAELGIGSTIAFSMYKPITEGDNQKVSALYCLYKKMYLIVSIIVLIAGLAITPFMPMFAKDYNSNFNLYVTFILMLISVVLTYGYGAKTSLINAYKNNYVTTTISSVGMIVQEVLQIIVLIIFRSFELYLICRIIASIFQYIWTEIYVRKYYKEIISRKENVDDVTRKEITKNTKAMFMHKIGGLLVNTTDSIIISVFIGVELLGKYSNYTTIISAMTGILMLFFTPLTSVIGHLCAKKDKNEEISYFNFFHSFNFCLGIIFFLGYYMVIDNIVQICFESSTSGSLVLPKSISFVITLNYFIQFMRQACFLFRDATGTFYYDRWKPLIEGILNIILSVLFVFYFGIVGVIISTIITNLLICYLIEPFVLFKYGFEKNPKNYIIKNYIYIFIFSIALTLISFIKININNTWLEFLVNGSIAVIIGIVPVVAIIVIDNNFRTKIFKIFKNIQHKLLNRKTKQKNC